MFEMFDLRKERAHGALLSWNVEGIRSRVGAVALYREGDWLCIVRVNQITVDDDRLECFISSVLTPGLDDPLPRENSLGTKLFTCWSEFVMFGPMWKANYVAWYLYFEEELIQEITAIAAAEASNGRILSFQQAQPAIWRFEDRQIKAALMSLNKRAIG